MQAAKGKGVTVPRGVFQGRVLRSLGSGCRADQCEAACSRSHSFWEVNLLPPSEDEEVGSTVMSGPCLLLGWLTWPGGVLHPAKYP
jgi:hypothetical protein